MGTQCNMPPNTETSLDLPAPAWPMAGTDGLKLSSLTRFQADSPVPKSRPSTPACKCGCAKLASNSCQPVALRPDPPATATTSKSSADVDATLPSATTIALTKCPFKPTAAPSQASSLTSSDTPLVSTTNSAAQIATTTSESCSAPSQAT